jgi:hypothetical protein
LEGATASKDKGQGWFEELEDRGQHIRNGHGRGWPAPERSCCCSERP